MNAAPLCSKGHDDRPASHYAAMPTLAPPPSASTATPMRQPLRAPADSILVFLAASAMDDINGRNPHPQAGSAAKSP
jgi:hypothetical protein